MNKNFISISIIIAALILGGVLIYLSGGKGGIKEEVLPIDKAVQRAIDFINENLSGGEKAILKESSEISGLYKFKIQIGSEEFESYVTRDGKLLLPQGIVLSEKKASGEEPASNTQIPKRDRPDVKIFVMSYCPFGLQAEKMFLPVYDLLKEKVDFGIYFVDYIMHGRKEMEENLRQYCIQKEEKEKYRDYLGCFLKEGKFEECQKEAKIDENKLMVCIKETDKIFKISEKFKEEGYPPFDIHKDLNEKYGVRGSPTIVVNDQVAEVSPRSPERFKEIICQAFNLPPKECEQKLSENQFSPGFGLETGSGGSGQCK